MNFNTNTADGKVSFAESVTNHVSALLAYWDKNLVCRFANDAYLHWFGKSHEEMIDKMTMKDLVGPDIYEQNLPYISGALDGKVQTFEREIPFLPGEGEGSRFTLANYYPNVVNGDVKGFFVHVADITNLKLLENELIASNQTIKEQNKRLLSFANIVTHNLKSYANNLGLILQLFIDADSEQEKNEMLNFLKDISSGFSSTMIHLSEIVDTQNKAIQLEPVSLHDYINKAIGTLLIDIKSTGAIIRNNVDKEIYVLANPAYLDSIILNFLTNSMKYRHPDRDPIIDLSASVKRKEVVLTIEDNGLGIDLGKYRSDLFGMYKTFHNNSDAKGVGLFLVKSQVDAMGGRIEVESEVGKGTKFRVIFKS